ncbi:MAG: pyridoxamine 5'-phosphate oxidase family protein [Candidatus Saccharimonadales bacterium]
MTPEQKAAVFLEGQTHMIVAVTCDDGRPWAVPVVIQQRDGKVFEWDSRLDAVHSLAIARDPRVAICLYRASSDEGEEIVVYGDGTAEIVEQRGEYARYRATLQTAWMNDVDHVKRPISVSAL